MLGLNVFLALISLVSCVCGEVFIIISIAASWAVLCPAFVIIFKTGAYDTLLPVSIFSVMQFGILKFKKSVTKYRKDLAVNLDISENIVSDLNEKLAELKARDEVLRKKELEIASLYEITRDMSASLKFNDIFNVFSLFLKDNFNFRKCDLLILNRSGAGEKHLERAYSVWHPSSRITPETEDRSGLSDATVNYDKLIWAFHVNPKQAYIEYDPAHKSVIFDVMGVSNPSVKSLAGVPLFSEDKLAAILVIENLPKNEFEKFSILSAQFSLEIKKVLLYETVEKMAITDSLTGLYVRRYFSERLEEEIGRSARHGFKFSFLMLDIDDFKKCNDTYGHLVGDVVLKDVARIVKESIREIDLVCRYGGEEFAVILPETPADAAMIVAQRIRRRAEEEVFKAYDERVKITLSIGLAEYPESASNSASLIDRADEALYRAKNAGKNVVCK